MWLREKSTFPEDCSRGLQVSGLEDPEFPPLIRGIPAGADDDPAGIALVGAASGEMSAGDIVWSRALSKARLAIILEPEVSAEKALSMVPLAMVTVADSIGAIGPPNLPITFDWPKTIFANGAVVGGVDMYFPDGTQRNDIPDFAVLSLSLDIFWGEDDRSHDGSRHEPGKDLSRTVLHEEGAGDLDRTLIIESWARHFLAWIDTWEQDGFRSVHENWLFRADRRNETVSVQTGSANEEGILLGMDEHGGLLLKQDNNTRLVALADLWFGGTDPCRKER